MILFFANHLYFLAALYFFFLWVVFFVVCPNYRSRMLKISLAIAALSAVYGPMTLVDWWHPNFLFTTVVTIEDILFGFSTAGVISALYMIIRTKISPSHSAPVSWKYKIVVTLLTLLILLGSFFILHSTSFWASLFALCIGSVLILFRKPHYILPVLCTGVLMLFIATPGYLLGTYLNPTWVVTEWHVDKLSGITFQTIPIEEFIWFFLAGVGVSSFQELFND